MNTKLNYLIKLFKSNYLFSYYCKIWPITHQLWFLNKFRLNNLLIWLIPFSKGKIILLPLTLLLNDCIILVVLKYWLVLLPLFYLYLLLFVYGLGFLELLLCLFCWVMLCARLHNDSSKNRIGGQVSKLSFPRVSYVNVP